MTSICSPETFDRFSAHFARLGKPMPKNYVRQVHTAPRESQWPECLYKTVKDGGRGPDREPRQLSREEGYRKFVEAHDEMVRPAPMRKKDTRWWP